jgi:hypothetical protein
MSVNNQESFADFRSEGIFQKSAPEKLDPFNRFFLGIELSLENSFLSVIFFQCIFFTPH